MTVEGRKTKMKFSVSQIQFLMTKMTISDIDAFNAEASSFIPVKTKKTQVVKPDVVALKKDENPPYEDLGKMISDVEDPNICSFLVKNRNCKSKVYLTTSIYDKYYCRKHFFMVEDFYDKKIDKKINELFGK
jgi:hypothetical protein